MQPFLSEGLFVAHLESQELRLFSTASGWVVGAVAVAKFATTGAAIVCKKAYFYGMNGPNNCLISLLRIIISCPI